MKNTVKILIIFLLTIEAAAHLNAEEPTMTVEIREIYNELTKPQLDSIRATYEVIDNVQKFDEGLKNFFESYYSNDETSSGNSNSDLFITLTSDEQIMLDFVNFGCGLDFGFRRCGYFFKPNLPELYQWYKNNLRYITDEQLKKYCELKSKMELYEINERFINWEFTNVIMRKYGWSLDVYNNINTFSDEESEKYLYELEYLKESFLERQYNLEENKK